MIFLVILQIVIFFGASMLWLFADDSLIGKSRLEKFTTRYSMNELGRKVSDALLEDTVFSCVIPQMSTETLRHLSAWFFKTHGCHVDASLNFIYLIEFLSLDPCSLIALAGETQATQYIRLTIKNKQDHYLQFIIAKPTLSSVACQDKPRLILQGIQLKRYL